jgi:hypothetical protein
MPTQLTPQQLRSMFDGQTLRLTWLDAVNNYNRLRVHADGELPIWLIKDARPNESDAARDYREKIYEPETQNPIERVFGVFEKIRRSPDWMIRFPTEVPPIIRAGETMEDYCTLNYPVYGNFEDWLFEDGLRNAGLDANAIIAVIPKEFAVAPTEFLQPVVYIFNSPDVVDFVADDYAVLKSKELSSLLSPEDQQIQVKSGNISTDYSSDILNRYQWNKYITESFKIGQVYYVITTNYFQKWELKKDGSFQLTQQYAHGLNELPAWQMPGKFQYRTGQYILKRSLLKPMVPHLNKAARESNDLDAGIIRHLHLQKWSINNRKCAACSGTGKVPSADGPVTCKQCDGKGKPTGTSPFEDVIIEQASLGQQSIPTPPVGYVEMPSEILKIANDRIAEHIQKSLDAVNMGHLGDVQLNQSGVAKAYDDDDVHTVVYAYAEILADIANISIYFMNKLRNKNLITNDDDLKKLLPIIPVPEKFDIVNTNLLLTEYQAAKTAGLNSIILRELQKEISQKKFYANPDVKDYIDIVMDVDPFPEKTIEEKALLEGQGLVTKQDIILSNYISDFVNRAMEESKNFGELTREKKREVLLKYANEKLQELSTADNIMQDILQSSSSTANANGQPANTNASSSNGNNNQQQNLKQLGGEVSTVKRLAQNNV